MAKESSSGGAQFQVSDRRFWVEKPESIEKASVPQEKYPTVVEQLKNRTEAAEAKLRERLEALEEENSAFRNRLSGQVEKRVKEEKASLISSLLEVVDNLERAIEKAEDPSHFDALKEGVTLNLEIFLSRLQSAGVLPIENLHQPFDPSEAEAVSVVPVDDPEEDDHIQEVIQKGYRLDDRILRPAIVTVGKYQ